MSSKSNKKFAARTNILQRMKTNLNKESFRSEELAKLSSVDLGNENSMAESPLVEVIPSAYKISISEGS